MQHNILFLFAYSNFELTSSKDLYTKVAAMRRKGVVFSKMFVLRSMGNELVPSPLLLLSLGLFWKRKKPLSYSRINSE